ncbi:hypothetical protein BLX42_20215 [Pseudomonas sp. SG-MS2]|nr:hypothetical protein BLX42_20215 [Pseudomonas sp. SG-MS2]
MDQAEGEEQEVYYFHTDQIGTPLKMSNSEGEIVWQATYRFLVYSLQGSLPVQTQTGLAATYWAVS